MCNTNLLQPSHHVLVLDEQIAMSSPRLSAHNETLGMSDRKTKRSRSQDFFIGSLVELGDISISNVGHIKLDLLAEQFSMLSSSSSSENEYDEMTLRKRPCRGLRRSVRSSELRSLGSSSLSNFDDSHSNTSSTNSTWEQDRRNSRYKKKRNRAWWCLSSLGQLSNMASRRLEALL